MIVRLRFPNETDENGQVKRMNFLTSKQEKVTPMYDYYEIITNMSALSFLWKKHINKKNIVRETQGSILEDIKYQVGYFIWSIKDYFTRR